MRTRSAGGSTRLSPASTTGETFYSRRSPSLGGPEPPDSTISLSWQARSSYARARRRRESTAPAAPGRAEGAPQERREIRNDRSRSEIGFVRSGILRGSGGVPATSRRLRTSQDEGGRPAPGRTSFAGGSGSGPFQPGSSASARPRECPAAFPRRPGAPDTFLSVPRSRKGTGPGAATRREDDPPRKARGAGRPPFRNRSLRDVLLRPARRARLLPSPRLRRTRRRTGRRGPTARPARESGTGRPYFLRQSGEFLLRSPGLAALPPSSSGCGTEEDKTSGKAGSVSLFSVLPAAQPDGRVLPRSPSSRRIAPRKKTSPRPRKGKMSR